MSVAQWRGACLAWTIHNIYPHERCVVPRLDIWVRRLLVRFGALFFIHCSCGEAEVLREFPALAGRMVVIQHGNWKGYYPDTITCSEARSRLALAEGEFVFLLLGYCRPYNLDPA